MTAAVIVVGSDFRSCNLCESPEGGVVSLHGEMYGYSPVGIAHSSVTSTVKGWCPTMTIAAVFECIVTDMRED